MKVHKSNVFAFGVFVLFFLVITSPVFCEAAAYSVQWEIDLESNYPGGLSVDIENNLYFNILDDIDHNFYFAKYDEDGTEVYNKTLNPEPDSYSCRMDDFGNYYFISIEEQVSGNSNLGKEFTFSKYSNYLIYETTKMVNLTGHFEGNFTANLYYVDSDCAYFAIWEYQDEYSDLDSIQLAKFSLEGQKLWNRTIADDPARTIFGFCKNIVGSIYVENEGELYYLDDKDGEVIWQRTIVVETPLIEVEDFYLAAFKENVLLVAFSLGGKLFLKLCRLDNSVGWEIVSETEEIYTYLTISSIIIEGDYLGIVTFEDNYVYEDKELTTIFNLKLVNMEKEVIYSERVEIIEEDEDGSNIRRQMRLYPTTDGNFYLYKYYSHHENDIEEYTIQYCIPIPGFSPGYTVSIAFTSVSFLVIAVIVRKRLRIK